jgi:hypothetical protein
LDDSLGTFDAELRREQENVARERDAREAANAGSASTGTESTDSEGEESGDSGTASTEGPKTAQTGTPGEPKGPNGSDRQGRPGDLKSEKQQGGTSAGTGPGSGKGAQQIPDGSDDDIVARRLRKAAEQETDPELKEKLWKEYIEYKKNNG